MKRTVIRVLNLGLMIAFIFFTGCMHQSQNGTHVKLIIDRFEEDLFGISVYHLKDSIGILQQKYPDFFPLFTAEVLEITDTSKEIITEGVISFTTDFTIYRVSNHVREIFPSLEGYETGLAEAFSRYKSFFPSKPVPRIISCITGFNQSMITSDIILAIGLDKYLGSEDEFYRLLYPPVPDYMRSVMIPEKITPDAMLAWIFTEFPYTDRKDNLLSQMIYNGRAFYMVHQLIPDLPDTLLWGFSSDQMNFSRKNEALMWEYLVEHKKLFASDPFTISQFIHEAPFTKDFSQESPGRVAIWIGYQIVSSYMAKNRDVSHGELMAENDYQNILNLSKYNP